MQRMSVWVEALAAAAVAGATADVSAAPADREAMDKETTERVRVTDEGGAAPGDTSEWIELASATPAEHGKEMIVVDPRGGPYLQLRIEARSGKPLVQKVVVYFADGGKRSAPIRRALEPAKEPALVDLERPRSIEQVVVHTSKSSPGTYVVAASPVRPAATPEDP